MRILLQGLQHAGQMPRGIVVSDPGPDALAGLRERFPKLAISPADNLEAATRELVILAVHPPVIPEVLTQIRPVLKANAVMVSLAPKFTFAKLSSMLGGFDRIVRIIPNAPSLIGAGYNPMAFSSSLPAGDRDEVVSLFAPLGEHPEVDETKLEGYALLSGMGPTYFWFQMQVLRELAAGFGLTEEEVVPALKRTLCGATRTLLESGLASAEVMDLVPVKPLGDVQGEIVEMYRTRLTALFHKIKP